MDTRLGILSKFYINDGTYGAPTWVEIDLISDMAVNGVWEEGDSSARRTRVATADPTRMTLELAGKVRVDRTDAGYFSLERSFLDTNVIDVLVLNGAKDQNNSSGYRFDAKIFNWSEDQAMGNVLYKDFSIKPCASDNAVKAAHVVGGVPVFTTIGTAGGSQ